MIGWGASGCTAIGWGASGCRAIGWGASGCTAIVGEQVVVERLLGSKWL